LLILVDKLSYILCSKKINWFGWFLDALYFFKLFKSLSHWGLICEGLVYFIFILDIYIHFIYDLIYLNFMCFLNFLQIRVSWYLLVKVNFQRLLLDHPLIVRIWLCLLDKVFDLIFPAIKGSFLTPVIITCPWLHLMDSILCNERFSSFESLFVLLLWLISTFLVFFHFKSFNRLSHQHLLGLFEDLGVSLF
jgi:hypothetical protein